MSGKNPENPFLSLILTAVFAFTAGLLGLSVIIILLTALGLNI